MATTFLSCIEREAHAEGEKEGEKSGRAKLVTQLIETQCGEGLSADLKKKIQSLSVTKLDKLGIAVLNFKSIKDVTTWLAD